MRYAYDCDGVLAVGPPDPPKPWRRMKGPEREAWRVQLEQHYRQAAVLYEPPPTQFFVVITARSLWAHQVTEAWLVKHYGPRVDELCTLVGARTIERVVEFKAGILRTRGITDYVEDNRTVVRGLRRAVPQCRIWHYKGGQMNLDYPEAPL